MGAEDQTTPETRRQLPEMQSHLRSFLRARKINFGDITASEHDRRIHTPLLVDFLYGELTATEHHPLAKNEAVKNRLGTLYTIRYTYLERGQLGAYTTFERKMLQEAALARAQHELPEIDAAFELVHAVEDTDVEPLAQDALVALYIETRGRQEDTISEAS
jgi:hypothetical protein